MEINDFEYLLIDVNLYIELVFKLKFNLLIETRKSCSETNTKATLCYRQASILNLFLSYINDTKLPKFKMAAKQPF